MKKGPDIRPRIVSRLAMVLAELTLNNFRINMLIRKSIGNLTGRLGKNFSLSGRYMQWERLSLVPCR